MALGRVAAVSIVNCVLWCGIFDIFESDSGMKDIKKGPNKFPVITELPWDQ
jgi:hypothetical protein